jgi:tetrahydromethanopterin S-methyltransferase subunit G
MPEDRWSELEQRLDALERRVGLVEEGYVEDDRRGRRARALNMWLRIAIYVMFLLLMVLFLVIFKVRF